CGCPNKQQVLTAVRQMQKLLSTQESQYKQGMRTMRRKLTLLQSSVNKQTETCPKLNVPSNGKKFGNKYSVSHEVHFACDPGFLLVGMDTRVCQDNKKWSGQQPFCKNINECSSNPCKNGGTCVDDINRYACLCPPGWVGYNCDHALFSHVDECELFQRERQARLCAHACVNTPGSYRCTCPPGYTLQEEGRGCDDVNECSSGQHNCSREESCINNHGGFYCVRPECPKSRFNASYVKTSQFKCERNPCHMDSKLCANAAYSITYHYLTLTSNLKTPRALFRMTTSRFNGDTIRFSIVGGVGQGHFTIQRSDRQTGELVLVHPVQGPATLEVEMEMTELSGKTILTKHVSKVIIYVSQYTF
uniref:Fibulin-7 n=1 Tax=Callorhinchus milii TaxID=7868 RepID=A0A4W3K018_CALMI